MYCKSRYFREWKYSRFGYFNYPRREHLKVKLRWEQMCIGPTEDKGLFSRRLNFTILGLRLFRDDLNFAIHSVSILGLHWFAVHIKPIVQSFVLESGISCFSRNVFSSLESGKLFPLFLGTQTSCKDSCLHKGTRKVCWRLMWELSVHVPVIYSAFVWILF